MGILLFLIVIGPALLWVGKSYKNATIGIGVFFIVMVLDTTGTTDRMILGLKSASAQIEQKGPTG